MTSLNDYVGPYSNNIGVCHVIAVFYQPYHNGPRSLNVGSSCPHFLKCQIIPFHVKKKHSASENALGGTFSIAVHQLLYRFIVFFTQKSLFNSPIWYCNQLMYLRVGRSFTIVITSALTCHSP